MIPATDAFRLALAQGGSQRYRYALSVVTQAPGGGAFTASSIGDLHVVELPSFTVDGSSSAMRSLTLTVALQPTRLMELETPGNFTSITSSVPYGDVDGVRFYADPHLMGDMLTKSAYVTVFAGVRVDDGTWLETQIAKLRVADYDFDYSGGTVDITLEDWVASVERAQLAGQWAPVSGSTPLTVKAACDALVGDAFPSGYLTAIGSTISFPASPLGGVSTKAGTAYTGSRVEAVNELLLPFKRGMRNNHLGNFTADLLTDLGGVVGATPVLEVITDTYQGVLVDYRTAPRDDGGYNAVQVAWSSADGSTYGTVFLVDNVTSSPTFYGGPYGRRVKAQESLESVNTEAEAIAAAEARLEQSKKRLRRATLTIPANPLLQPDDLIRVRFPRAAGGIGVEEHEIDSISHTLGEAVMQVETTVVSS